MYWIFLLLFVLAVLTPDIIRGPFYFLSEERVEEGMIFVIGILAFIIFLKKEKIIRFHRKEKEKDRKKINQTVKDLVESYSYIGEVNRKMDLLMNIALGLTDKSVLNKKKEKEIYESIVGGANFLMKADRTCLRFFEVEKAKTIKEFHLEDDKRGSFVKNGDLSGMEKNVNVKKCRDCLIVSSPRKISGIKAYLIIEGYDVQEEKNLKNAEILKVFASQALFLYSYINKIEDEASREKKK